MKIMSLPKRPRSHVLEEESRRAFKSTLPSSWIIRDLNPDYGIDAQVEVVTEDLVSGLEFYAQIRATDEQNLGRALKLRFRTDQLAYFATLAIPVLIVRYHAPSKKLFFRWFHHENPSPDRKSLTISLEPSDELTREAADSLAEETMAVRRFRASNPGWPIQFNVSAPEDGAHGMTSEEMATAFSGWAGSEKYVRFATGPLTRPYVAVTTAKTVVHLGPASTTIWTPNGVGSRDSWLADVIMGISLALGVLGHEVVAARIAALCAADSTMTRDPITVLRIAGFYHRGALVAEGLGLARRLWPTNPFAGELFASLVALADAASLSPDEKEEVRKYYEWRLERAVESGDPIAEARASYTFGNWLFHNAHSYEQALRAYQRAAELEPEYGKRDYFCHELAAANFETGRFADAVAWYERSIALSSRPKTWACLADSLMMNGQYDRALEAFEAYCESTGQPESVWRLKEKCLRFVIATTNVTEQVRQAAEADVMAADAEGSPDTASSVELVEQSLGLDALCGRAWFLKGRRLIEEQKYSDAALPLLQAALMAGDVDVWVEVILVAGANEDEQILKETVDVAVAHHGRDVSTATVARLANFPPEAKSSLMGIINEAVDEALREPRGFTLRLPKPDGDMEPIEFGED